MCKIKLNQICRPTRLGADQSSAHRFVFESKLVTTKYNVFISHATTYMTHQIKWHEIKIVVSIARCKK
jgi:hypothetical protein